MDTPVARSKVPFFGLIWMILASAIVAVALGALAAAIRIYLNFYLVLVFPLFMGAILGGAISTSAKMGRVRSGAFAVFVAIVMSLVMYGSYRYGEYFLDLQQTYAAHPDVDKAQIDARIDAGLAQETGQSGFIGYVMATAHDGIKIVSTNNYNPSDTSTDMTLQGNVLYGYWGVEILIIIVMAVALGRKSASIPFCEKDNRFFALRSVGRVPKDSADQFVTMVKAGDWHGANMLLDRTGKKMRYPYLEVTAYRCPECNTNPVPLSVISKRGSRKNSQRVIFKTTLNPTQYADFAGIPAEATAPALAY